jgi:hypothetical protein
VLAGKDVWHKRNCVNCHTLMGEGAYYAPDLTQITMQRGEAYLMQFLGDPGRFYSEEVHRRLMPDPRLTERERREVIAFLDWISKIENQNWPPRPILVSGGAPGWREHGARARRHRTTRSRRARRCSTRRRRAVRRATRQRRAW